MNSPILKKALPHLIAIAVFLLIAIVYCRPALEGKVVFQSDMLQWKGMAQQSMEFKEKHGHFPLWTEGAFGGAGETLMCLWYYNHLLKPKTNYNIRANYLLIIN